MEFLVWLMRDARPSDWLVAFAILTAILRVIR